MDRVDNDIQAFSFFDPDKRISEYMSKGLAEFLCFQLFNYAIRHQSHNEKTKRQMIKTCREYFQDDPTEQMLN
jgi:hypothetical protein